MQQPELYLANVQEYFDENGQLAKKDTADFLIKALDSYINFASKFY